jgi:hypothetical protein
VHEPGDRLDLERASLRIENVVEDHVVVGAVGYLQRGARSIRIEDGVVDHEVVVRRLGAVSLKERDATLDAVISEVVLHHALDDAVEVETGGSAAMNDVRLDEPVGNEAVSSRRKIGVDLNAVRADVVDVVASNDGVVGGVRDVDAVLAVVVDVVVLNRQIQRKPAENAVVPSGNDGATVVVAVVILNDDIARVGPIVLVSQNGDPRSRRAGNLEPIDRHEAARGELHEVLSVRSLPGSVDLRASLGLRLENDARCGSAVLAVAGEAGVSAVGDGDRVTGRHRFRRMLERLPWRRSASRRRVVASGTDEVVDSAGVSRVRARHQECTEARGSHG